MEELNMVEYSVIKAGDGAWRIEEGYVRIFLLEGTQRAMLIDSGMDIHNAKEIAESLTDKPVSLINTHADFDHIGSNVEWDKVYMHPEEEGNYRTNGGTSGIIPVRDGDVIDLGGRELKIMHIPGHTPGSIGILDRNTRVLISGDPVQNGRIFMFGEYRSMERYVEGLEHLLQHTDEFDELWPSHAELPVYPALIGDLCDTAKKILAGEEFPYTEEFMYGENVRITETGYARFLLPSDN